MPNGISLRFVKTPGSVQLPEGISRQYRVFRGEDALLGEPEVVFDLDKAHMRGLTKIRQKSGEADRLDCRSKVGASSWNLLTAEGRNIARISGPGLLASGWKLELAGVDTGLELRDPVGIGKEIARTMLNGDTEGLALTMAGVPLGAVTRQHRDGSQGSGGFLSGLKRFITGRDWVLELKGKDVPHQLASGDGLVALASFTLAAIVSLEMSSAA